ncbi:MAG: hypothetical protein AAGH99_08360 [Planctomycetota bacterium]
MGLDIGLAENPGGAFIETEPSLCLEDDGYFAFINEHIGDKHIKFDQRLDSYGDAAFAGIQIKDLQKRIQNLHSVASRQPEEWSQKVGDQIYPECKEIRQTLERQILLDLLDTLLNIIDRSIETNLTIVCYGD